jgi:DNA-3-methyladenine glycosylase
VLAVARACVGQILVTRRPDGVAAGRIVEAEAYRGPDDLAAHSAGGRRTHRTEVMFGRAGHAYVFLIYGMHWAFNVVVAEEGQPHAVLIRAIEPALNAELMARRRGIGPLRREVCNGPGKLCAALDLTGDDYGKDLCSPEGDVFLAAGRGRPRIGVSERINVDYAGDWARRPWRFYEKGNPYVSVAPRT